MCAASVQSVRIGALASGTGTILDALIEADLPIAVVVVDRICGAEEIAEKAGIPVMRHYRTDFSATFDREEFARKLVSRLELYLVDVLVMAGYGTVLGAPLHDSYPGRVLNTHPALLPSFKGWHAVRDALAAGATVTGCTVHVATLNVDEGPILAQQSVPILEGDTEESLHERIKQVERRLYPQTVHQFLEELAQQRS